MQKIPILLDNNTLHLFYICNGIKEKYHLLQPDSKESKD